MNAKTIELHLIQSFPPSCVNRDENNSPKDCTFGGVRRARISSQCEKRAIRSADSFHETVGAMAIRSRKLVRKIAQLVDGVDDRDPSLPTLKRVKDAFAKAGVKFKDAKKGQEDDPSADEWTSSLLLYLGESVLERLASRFREPTGSDMADVVIEEIIQNIRVPEIALFGRMLAIEGSSPLGKTNLNVDAACQVAHAISTHALAPSFDFWTAVDSLQPDGVPGAGMMGRAEFNASVFYRYACVSIPVLRDNLAKDEELVRKTIEAFLWASWDAIPTGKLNGHAHFNEPSLALAVVREQGAPANLVNAFERPITPTMHRRNGEPTPDKESLLINSAWELGRYYQCRRGAERFEPSEVAYWHGLDAGELPGFPSGSRTVGYRALVERVMAAL